MPHTLLVPRAIAELCRKYELFCMRLAAGDRDEAAQGCVIEGLEIRAHVTETHQITDNSFGVNMFIRCHYVPPSAFITAVESTFEGISIHNPE